jgi:mannose-6-phosphate isomerase-like protein (cupin superfamily)
VEDGVSTEVGAGDVILTEKGVRHSILNNGKHPLVYVAIRS